MIFLFSSSYILFALFWVLVLTQNFPIVVRMFLFMPSAVVTV